MLLKDLIEAVDNDAAHSDAHSKTGFWGKQGAGCVIVAEDTGKLLLPYRSMEVLDGGHTWGTWGGAIDEGEDPKTAAIREMEEESGMDPSLIVKVIPLFVFKSGTFKYSNFLIVVKQEFKPTLNWETESYKWVSFDNMPKPLHMGLTALLADSKSVQIIKSYIKSKE